jgi:hypothetical protein
LRRRKEVEEEEKPFQIMKLSDFHSILFIFCISIVVEVNAESDERSNQRSISHKYLFASKARLNMCKELKANAYSGEEEKKKSAKV